MEDSVPTVDVQLDLIRQCLGLYSIQPASPSRPTVSAAAALMPVGLPVGFLVDPRLIGTVSCKWKKDRKPCGITDVALTDDGRVFVADSLNKAVKIYDSLQV